MVITLQSLNVWSLYSEASDMIIQEKTVSKLMFLMVSLINVSSTVLPCKQACEAPNGTRSVSYPFGFSSGCPIELNCSSSGDIKIGGYLVRNITDKHLSIDLPAAYCNRSIDDFRNFLGNNFAISSRNKLLLNDCNTSDTISSTCLLEERKLVFQRCTRNGHISCYYGANNNSFFNYDVVTKGCRSLVTSSVSGSGEQMELEWQLFGTCDCTINDECIEVNLSDPGGYRCSCKHIGDGYPNSTGCKEDVAPVALPPVAPGALPPVAGQHSVNILPIVGGLVIFVVVVAAMLFFFILRPKMRMWISLHGNDSKVETFMKQFGPVGPKQYSYSEIKKMTNSFAHKLGQGGYGSVYKGNFSDGRLVAVKVLSETKGNGEDFINEVSSISNTSHVNIVTLLGFCYHKNQRALIYQFMPNGSLDEFLNGKSSSSSSSFLNWNTLYKIAIGVARGLEYLHRDCNTRIVHLDIKPHNILLDDAFCPKISDFGLAKLSKTKDTNFSKCSARGTIGYIAPEVIFRHLGGVSHKSDVYSYGMMVLEMVGVRTKPLGTQEEISSQMYFPNWIYEHLELGADMSSLNIQIEEEETEEGIKRKLIMVGLWCVQTNPSERPSMSEVSEMLEGNLQSLSIPPKHSFLYPPTELPQISSIKSQEESSLESGYHTHKLSE